MSLKLSKSKYNKIMITKVKIFHLTFFTVIFFFGYGCSQENSTIISDETTDNQNTYESIYDDMLTPAYYLTSTEASFKNEVNQFLSSVHQEEFVHPLKGLTGELPNFEVRKEFGGTRGFEASTQYHPAIDIHVGNTDTNVLLYAAHEGYISIARDVDKYRQYVAITKEIEDDNGNIIGKLFTIYAHVDLDLDAPEYLYEEGDYISKGALISKHLYSETVGGPHLHFEVRYYRATDIGNETFYGGNIGDLTQASAGNWLYGYWNPTVGYGFGNPKNHELFLY